MSVLGRGRLRALVRRGFSLLEVMVAIAILGLTLTVILSAQGGLAASNRSAANMGLAVSLGRCKMTEIEEKLIRLGYQEIDQLDTDVPCCDDEKHPKMACDTRIEKIELPNMNSGGGGDGGGGGLGAASPLAALSNPGGGPGLNLATPDGGVAGLGSMMQGNLGLGGSGGAGAAGMLTMVLGIVYPSIKPMYEASIRRVTVKVRWKEGPNERELELVQFVTNPQRGGLAGSALMADGGAMDFAPPAGSGTPGADVPGGGGARSTGIPGATR